MRIKRANFRFNRLVNVDDIIGHSNLLLMEQEDINVDNNVHDCILKIICANFYIIAKFYLPLYITFNVDIICTALFKILNVSCCCVCCCPLR